MRHLARIAAISSIVAALGFPAAGQRAGSHGGISGHPASGSHGFSGSGFAGRGFGGHGFAGSHPVSGIGSRGSFGRVPMRGGPAGPPRFGGNAGTYRFVPRRGPAHSGPGYRTPGGRMPYRGGSLGPDHGRHSGDGDHHHHRGEYWRGGVYFSPVYSWGYTGPIFTGYVDPWLFGPDDYDGYNGGYSPGYDAAPYADYGRDYPTQPNPVYAQGAALPQAQSGQQEPVNAPAAQSYSAAPLRQSAVTLIFNDGRPPEQIHNFLLTPTTLTVLDAQYREISLKDVNVPATQAANRAAGVEFRVPATN